MMRPEVRRRLKTGGTILLKTMDDESMGVYAVIDSLVGEKPHAALLVATHENPAMLRRLLKLIDRLPSKKKRKG